MCGTLLQNGQLHLIILTRFRGFGVNIFAVQVQCHERKFQVYRSKPMVHTAEKPATRIHRVASLP